MGFVTAAYCSQVLCIYFRIHSFAVDVGRGSGRGWGEAPRGSRREACSGGSHQRAHILLPLRTAPLGHIPLPKETERQRTRKTKPCGRRDSQATGSSWPAPPSSAWMHHPGADGQEPEPAEDPRRMLTDTRPPPRPQDHRREKTV